MRLLDPFIGVVGDNLPEFWGVLALARAQSGDDAGAEQAIDKALDLDPGEEHAIQARELIG
jgi:Flp pilus assembly protein TadD